jgi:hypothetical protein
VYVQPAVAVKVKTGAVPAGKTAVNWVVVVGVMAVKLVGGVQYCALRETPKKDKNNKNVSQKRMRCSSSDLVVVKLTNQKRKMCLCVAYYIIKKASEEAFF